MANTEFNNELKCHVISLSYDFQTNSGSLYMAHGNCCDMQGCISVFTRIDPNVKSISTYREDISGNIKDTAYIKSGSEWHEFLTN